MNFDSLSPDEKNVILKIRKNKKEIEEQEAFQLKSIETALSFLIWSRETNEGITFSTFVNTFGYQDDDGYKMFNVVSKILDAAAP
ncbi:hypothetical protein [Dickeya sp. NCPPB 3274]|uniref:hypothetical protein n=1 Tax=Dickeya sp. NCPPB 3274 TaxID=568766 RepID=UPI0005B4B398|nr:hypothetical protein [Dickeya sp. NCPPB 3274]